MEIVTPPESPITAHNRALCTEVMKATKTQSRYPRVSEQVECLALETQKLHKFGYNNSLNSKGWMAYRYHVSKLATRLAVAQLGENGAVISDRKIQMTVAGKSVDDPKVFSHGGQDFLSWVEATWDDADYQNTIRCVVKRAKFNGAELTDIVTDGLLPGNDGKSLQKNFIYFSHDGELHVIYECAPALRIFRISDFTQFTSPGIAWPYGTPKGDTAPLPYEGKLMRFFHSRLDNEKLGSRHRYYIGAVLHNAEPPFAVERVSKRPIVYGSEINGVKKADCPHWKANVVFGGSAVEKDGAFLLPIGVNDSEMVITKITEKELNF